MLRSRTTLERQASVLLHQQSNSDHDDKKAKFGFKTGKPTSLLNRIRFSKHIKALKPVYNAFRSSPTAQKATALVVGGCTTLVVLYLLFTSLFTSSVIDQSKSVLLSGADEREMMANINAMMLRHSKSALHASEEGSVVDIKRFCLDTLPTPINDGEAMLNIMHFVNAIAVHEDLGYDAVVITPSGGIIDPTNTNEAASVIAASQHCPYLDTLLQVSKAEPKKSKQSHHNKRFKDAFDQHFDTLKMDKTVKDIGTHFDTIAGECKDATADMSEAQIDHLVANVLQHIFEIVDEWERNPNQPHPAKHYFFDQTGDIFTSEPGFESRVNHLRKCRYLETFLNDPNLHKEWNGKSTRDLVTHAEQMSQHVASLIKGHPDKESTKAAPAQQQKKKITTKTDKTVSDPISTFQGLFSYNGPCRAIPKFLGSDDKMNTLTVDLLNHVWHPTKGVKEYYITTEGHVKDDMPTPTENGPSYQECAALDDLLNNDEIRQQWTSEYSLGALIPQVLVKPTTENTIDTSKDALVTIKSMLSSKGECSNLVTDISSEAAKDLAISIAMKVWSPKAPTRGFYGVDTRSASLTYSKTADALSAGLATCSHLDTLLTSKKLRADWVAKESSSDIVQRLVKNWDSISTGFDINALLNTKEPVSEIKKLLQSHECKEATSNLQTGRFSDLVVNVVSRFWGKSVSDFEMKHSYYFDTNGNMISAASGDFRCDDLDTLMNSLDVHKKFTTEQALSSAITAAIRQTSE